MEIKDNCFVSLDDKEREIIDNKVRQFIKEVGISHIDACISLSNCNNIFMNYIRKKGLFFDFYDNVEFLEESNRMNFEFAEGLNKVIQTCIESFNED